MKPTYFFLKMLYQTPESASNHESICLPLQGSH